MVATASTVTASTVTASTWATATASTVTALGDGLDPGELGELGDGDG